MVHMSVVTRLCFYLISVGLFVFFVVYEKRLNLYHTYKNLMKHEFKFATTNMWIPLARCCIQCCKKTIIKMFVKRCLGSLTVHIKVTI